MINETNLKRIPEQNVKEAKTMKLNFDEEIEKVREELEKLKIESIKEKINQL